MIAIINISKHNDNEGENEYRLQINRKLIGTFTHIRKEGLAVCLQKAAECAEKENWERIRQVLARNAE